MWTAHPDTVPVAAGLWPAVATVLTGKLKVWIFLRGAVHQDGEFAQAGGRGHQRFFARSQPEPITSFANGIVPHGGRRDQADAGNGVQPTGIFLQGFILGPEAGPGLVALGDLLFEQRPKLAGWLFGKGGGVMFGVKLLSVVGRPH